MVSCAANVAWPLPWPLRLVPNICFWVLQPPAVRPVFLLKRNLIYWSIPPVPQAASSCLNNHHLKQLHVTVMRGRRSGRFCSVWPISQEVLKLRLSVWNGVISGQIFGLHEVDLRNFSAQMSRSHKVAEREFHFQGETLETEEDETGKLLKW